MRPARTAGLRASRSTPRSRRPEGSRSHAEGALDVAVEVDVAVRAAGLRVGRDLCLRCLPQQLSSSGEVAILFFVGLLCVAGLGGGGHRGSRLGRRDPAAAPLAGEAGDLTAAAIPRTSRLRHARRGARPLQRRHRRVRRLKRDPRRHPTSTTRASGVWTSARYCLERSMMRRPFRTSPRGPIVGPTRPGDAQKHDFQEVAQAQARPLRDGVPQRCDQRGGDGAGALLDAARGVSRQHGGVPHASHRRVEHGTQHADAGTARTCAARPTSRASATAATRPR